MKQLTILLLCLSVFMVRCQKDKVDPENPTANKLKNLSGTIYYKWADEGVFKIDLQSAGRSLLLQENIRRNNWDVSWDNQFVLECTDVEGDYLASRFALSKIADGTIARQFKYYATEGDIATGILSPNGQLIAINPTFHDGIVITDMEGNEIRHILTVNNEKITENPTWMPDNTLLIVHQQMLLKTNADFTKVSLLKEFDFQEWGTPVVSRDGKRIAFVAAKHVWLMNADGTDMKQVTNSSGAETFPQFSPDGKSLLVGTDFHASGPFGNLFYLKVIPADGKQYQVDDGAESEGVIPVILPERKQIEAGDGRMRWR